MNEYVVEMRNVQLDEQSVHIINATRVGVEEHFVCFYDNYNYLVEGIHEDRILAFYKSDRR